ncbi:cytochrome P450 [Luteipulveratus sp. YIM 133132]|uniref:cytochrome P450 n=1 Tax=Luteipulveratus flavus TaxID=3031728 RepID=UPI0023B03A4E|nr:cytochrome P450 [Luteipulveratus sp. YIM 133132]MDE9366138.1 cytochrome P450 [Luteipulveratus sp. YIM 133132]
MSSNWPHLDLPHPPGRRPVIGDLLTVRPPRPLQNLLLAGEGLGPIFEIRLARQKMVFVQDTALARELCDESRFEKKLPPGLVALRESAGDGLFTAYSDEPSWSLAHDLLRPAFTKEAMRRYHDVMNAVCDELITYWDAQDGPVDVSPALTKMTLETIGRTSFSTTFDSFASAQEHPFVTAMVQSLRRGQRRGALAALPGGSLLLRRGAKAFEQHRAYVATTLDGIVRSRIADADSSTSDLLGLMLHSAHEQSGERLDPVNIRFQINTFLVAGHETTSGALSFALHFMTRDPAVLARAQAEVDAVLGSDPTAVPAYEQVAKLRYVRRCLDEALRLWPTAPAFTRGPRTSTVLGGRYPMRSDDWATVLIPAVHRDPQVWGEAAETYDPDHFLPARVRARPAHTYFPFGVGERACIGRQFALHEAVLVLARLLHRYDMTPDPDYELEVSERLTLMPVAFRLGLSRRTPGGGEASPAVEPEPEVAEAGRAGCPVAHSA